MIKHTATLLILLMISVGIPNDASAEPVVRLSTINWEPYTGEKLPEHGFFSELVTESFARAGYRVEFHYRPWSRALLETKKGKFDGVMDVYWKKDRTEYLKYPDVVWKVREDFIALRETAITYTGSLTDLQGLTIGVLRGSAQAEELQEAGLQLEKIDDQQQNVKKLLLGRIDVMLIPRPVFFYHLERLVPQFDRRQVQILQPSYKVFNMYVAFSKQTPGYEKLTADFNRGLRLIKNDGTYEKILRKHNIAVEI